MVWHYPVWKDRLFSLPRPEGSILQQAMASPWYMPGRDFAPCRGATRRQFTNTIYACALWQPYRLLKPFWHIPWRCHGLLQYRPFGPGKGMTLSSPASDFQEIDFGKSDFCNYLSLSIAQSHAIYLLLGMLYFHQRFKRELLGIQGHTKYAVDAMRP